MILKQQDDVAPRLAELERLTRIPAISKAQRDGLEEELWRVRMGAKNEKQAAYHIDFDWKDGVNSVVIHDLRIEHEGRVAQIDHLILSRGLNCHVMESKGFGQEVRISEAGEWETRTRFGWKGMASPVEQNRRHIDVLEAFIRDHRLAPKRLGLTMPIRFINWVLVAPDCPLRRQGTEWNQVVKMDMFRKEYLRRSEAEGALDTIATLSKIVSLETIEHLGRALVAAHRPAAFDYRARFGLPTAVAEDVLDPNDDARFAPPSARLSSVPRSLPVLPPPLVENRCEDCSTGVEAKVAEYCRARPKKFGGRVLCRSCQAGAPTSRVAETAPRSSVVADSRRACEDCGTELDGKVIAFCRFNSKRFGGKRLCRTCQGNARPVAKSA